MATLSAAERKKYREKQKLKQGIALGTSSSPVVIADPPQGGKNSPVVRSLVLVDKGTEVVASDTSVPRPPPVSELPAAKKQKTGPNVEIGLPTRGPATNDSSWKNVLKCPKRADAAPDAPVWSTFDSRYPLNRVLYSSADPADVEKVASLGVQRTLVAVKSYSHWASVLAHLAEDAFNKTMAEHARLEESSKKNEEDLKSCQEERGRLILELQKWDAEKTRLEGKVFELSEEKKRLATALEKSAGDLEKAWGELERRGDELKRISALFPDLAEGSDLAEAVDDLKAAAAQEYGKGFEAALEQLKVLYPDADVERFDIGKVVVDG